MIVLNENESNLDLNSVKQAITKINLNDLKGPDRAPIDKEVIDIGTPVMTHDAMVGRVVKIPMVTYFGDTRTGVKSMKHKAMDSHLFRVVANKIADEVGVSHWDHDEDRLWIYLDRDVKADKVVR